MSLAGVQFSATVGCEGYHPLPLRTGYEEVIASRASNNFAHNIEFDGKVKRISKDYIEIEGKDQTRRVRLGKWQIESSGKTIAHNIVTDLKEGDKVKANDVVAWVESFFERDWVNPGNATFKYSVMATVALPETSATLEDGSSISKRLSEKLNTSYGKKRVITVPGDKEVKGLVSVGDSVEMDTPLCIIQDAAVSQGEINDESLLGLSRYSRGIPKAKFKGEIHKIEVFYNGVVSEMTESARKIIEADNRRRAKEAKDFGTPSVTGEVPAGTRIYSKELEKGEVAVVVYMNQTISGGNADKGVVGHQLKTVFGEQLPEGTRTMSGDPIDIVFGRGSTMDRIVRSIEIMGVKMRYIKKVNEKAVSMYFNEE